MRWVETSKGTAVAPKVRSRLVCQEFAIGNDPDGDLFAPTPPLGATRLLLSNLASNGRNGPGNHRAMFLDFTRAFLYGDAERELYIEIPDEDPDKKGGINVGRLRKAMYGTRDAPAVWQILHKNILTELNFKPSRTTPCVYWNRERQLRVVAHVDDFLVTGPKGELLALKASLKRDYEVDGDVLSVEEGDAKQAEFLGRTISAQDWGIEIEADGRLAKGLLEEFDPESKLRADTPGMKLEEDETPKELMVAAGAHKFRRGAPKLNYLAQDRADLSFASKEISRRMSAPAVGDEVLLT